MLLIYTLQTTKIFALILEYDLIWGVLDFLLIQ